MVYHMVNSDYIVDFEDIVVFDFVDIDYVDIDFVGFDFVDIDFVDIVDSVDF